MFRLITILFCTILFSVNSFAQTENYSAPIKWQKFKVSANEVSVMLPKFPVFTDSPDPCGETETKIYWAYADEAAYSLKITAKTKQKAPKDCIEKRSFDRNNLHKVISELQNLPATISKEKITLKGKQVTKLSSKFSTIWLFDDLKNDRWFELQIQHREGKNPDSQKFVDSIDFKNYADGIEIGNGAERTLGDAENSNESLSQTNKEAEKNLSAEKTFNIMIVSKPRANYTDEARNTNTQGITNLRVTFLANGGIGSISVINALPYGLTENAIKAAKKLVFIPAKRNGQNISVIRTVQYNFTIY